jgi:hypothetical protein
MLEDIQNDEIQPPAYSSVYIINSNKNQQSQSQHEQINYRVPDYSELFQYCQESYQMGSGLTRNKCLSEHFTVVFTKSYLNKHFKINVICSIILILLQIYLMMSEVGYNNFGCGFILALFNMLTLFISLVTSIFIFILII